ncbi:MAG: EamA family transporter [Acidiferrobacterales bacterium]
MEPFVIAIVLASAVMHAIWNAVVKVGDDRLMSMAVAIGVTALLAPLLLLVGPAPAPASWKFILLSALLNNAYFLFLIEAYRVGDLSHAYPLARGSAPLLVAVGSVAFAGEQLSVVELIGVGLVSGGIASLLFSADYGLRGGWRSIVYPLATGVMIASYTVVDGIGVRLSGNPAAYIGWLFVFFAGPILLLAALRRRTQAITFLRLSWKPAAIAGVLNFGSYGLAIWALSLGAMAHVSALRETSVIIGAWIGTRVLGEPFGWQRVMSAAIVAAGVILINVGA